jgi:DNA repair protein SbcC/Rad50
VRPLQLELVGFRSYDRATVDWRPHDLVVISGDTGAGKTSLLDAISFALYGRSSQQATGGDLLTLGQTHGEVRLEFALADDVWRVTRRFGKDAPQPSALLERLDGDRGPVLETIGGDEAVGAGLAALLRMSFAAFTSAVLLAQGRFDQFLAAKPKDRDDILRELFDVASLDGARQSAVASQKACLQEAEVYRAEGARLTDTSSVTRWAAARTARDRATDRAAVRALGGIVARVNDLDEATRRHANTSTLAQRAAHDLPDEAARADLAGRWAGFVAANADTERDVIAARAAHTAAEARRAATRAEACGDSATLATALAAARQIVQLDSELPARETHLSTEAARIAAERAALGDVLERLTATQTEIDRLKFADAAAKAVIVAATAEDAARAAHATAHAAVEVSARDLKSATARARTARAQVDNVRRADMAAAVRATMTDGDTCPVCGGTLAGHIAHAPDLAAADRDDRDARHEETAAGTRLAAARVHADHASEHRTAAEHASVEASEQLLAFGTGEARELAAEWAARIVSLEAKAREPRDAATATHDRLTAAEGVLVGERTRLEADRARMGEMRAALGAWSTSDDPIATLETLGASLATDERAEREAADAMHAAAARASAAARGLDGFIASEVSEIRAAAARAAAALGREAPVAGEVAPLLDAVSALRQLGLNEAADAARAAERTEAQAAAERDRLRLDGEGLGVSAPDDYPQARRRLVADAASAQAALADLTTAASHRRRLDDQERDARLRAERHSQVANDLRANAFPRYLLGRFRERLAVGASTRLTELSAGAYRFSGTGADPLSIIDKRRGERPRNASTLSGGERFLASLALALGLSDIAAESGGRLDCLFLDEGFSTLDAEALEQALTGVERLSGDGRLIAVITHLPGVAERLGAMIRVEKDAEGRSRIDNDARDPGPRR